MLISVKDSTQVHSRTANVDGVYNSLIDCSSRLDFELQLQLTSQRLCKTLSLSLFRAKNKHIQSLLREEGKKLFFSTYRV